MATKYFTPEQRTEVDKVVTQLVRHCCRTIDDQSRLIKQMDKRPYGSWNPADPKDSPANYNFPYVAQGMLEDLIEKLEEMV